MCLSVPLRSSRFKGVGLGEDLAPEGCLLYCYRHSSTSAPSVASTPDHTPESSHLLSLAGAWFRLSLNSCLCSFSAHLICTFHGEQGVVGHGLSPGVFSLHIWSRILSNCAPIGGFHLPAVVSVLGFSFEGSLVQMYWLSPAFCLPFVPIMDDID